MQPNWCQHLQKTSWMKIFQTMHSTLSTSSENVLIKSLLSRNCFPDVIRLGLRTSHSIYCISNITLLELTGCQCHRGNTRFTKAILVPIQVGLGSTDTFQQDTDLAFPNHYWTWLWHPVIVLHWLSVFWMFCPLTHWLGWVDCKSVLLCGVWASALLLPHLLLITLIAEATLKD